jgi:3-phytase
MVITSDKSGHHVFVYDLQGRMLQAIPVRKPGNIDIRQGVPVRGELLDVVVVNQRSDGFALVAFSVNAESRSLERIDLDCTTDPNYGGCLFLSRKSKRLFFFCTSEEGSISQYELKFNNDRRMKANKVRELRTGKCEGAVADDELADLYIADETSGIWKFSAEPDGPSTGAIIAGVGENGLKGDVEGLSICKLQDGRQCLVVSDQGNSRFSVYNCDSTFSFMGAFQIEGVGETDGIDICMASIGPEFPQGIFACHNGLTPGVVNLTSWAAIEGDLLSSPPK